MSVLDYARVRGAFDACIAVESERRSAALAAISLSQDERAELDSLLAAHDAHAAHDEMSIRIRAAAANSISALERPARLGPWRITGEIGEGGMGVVLSAVRDDGEYEQSVAIKVIRGFSSAAARDRLRRERQILASLEHPNIARLLGGGSTPGGEPYLVMEYVDGEPLGEWLARAQPLRDRITLFAAICRAVAFAHQRLVVHRDLKPANVLVRRNGSPVLLDFGIAKLVEADDTAGDGTRTHTMTPAYASPEQLRGEAVTTASDVFGLGLLLFVLLGGDVRQRLDPLRAATTSVDSASNAARNSEHASVRAFAPQLRGDLDAIVRQATRLDPTRRYPAATLLLQDVEAWLDGRPLAARAGDHWYQLRKLAYQYRAVLAFGLLLMLAAAGFTAQLAVERNRARSAEARALQEAATAREVVAFLTGMFADLDPRRSPDTANLSARELLDRGRANLDLVPASSPQARATLQRSLGDVYRASSQPQQAIELLSQARAVFAADPAAAADLIDIDTVLSQAHNDLLDVDAALAAAERAVAAAQPREQIDPQRFADSLMSRGVARQRLNRFDQAMADFERAQALFERSGEQGRRGLTSVLHNRGWVAEAQGRNQEALEWYEKAVLAKRALLGEDNPFTFNSVSAQAKVLAFLGRNQQAAAVLDALIPRVARVLGERSLSYRLLQGELGSVLQDLGRWSDAETAYLRGLEISRATEGDALSARTAAMLNNLATLREERGDLMRAEQGYRESLTVRLRTLNPADLGIARAQGNLARALIQRGELVEAGQLIEQASASRRAALPAGHPELLVSDAQHLEWQLARGDLGAAGVSAGQLRDGLASTPTAPAPRSNARILAVLARHARAIGDTQRAVALLQSALEKLGTALPDNHPGIALLRLDLAETVRASDPARARSLRAQAQAVLEVALVADAPQRARFRDE